MPSRTLSSTARVTNLKEWVKEVKIQLADTSLHTHPSFSECGIPQLPFREDGITETWTEEVLMRCVEREAEMYRRCKREGRHHSFTIPADAIAYAVESVKVQTITEPDEETSKPSTIVIDSHVDVVFDSDDATRPHPLDSLDDLIELWGGDDSHTWVVVKAWCAAVLRRQEIRTSDQIQSLACSREKRLPQPYKLEQQHVELGRREAELSTREAELAAKLKSFSKREADLRRLRTLLEETDERRNYSDSSIGRAKESSRLWENLRKARDAEAQAVRTKEQQLKTKEENLNALAGQLRVIQSEQDTRERSLDHREAKLRENVERLEQAEKEFQSRAAAISDRQAQCEDEERTQRKKEAALRRDFDALRGRESAIQQREADVTERLIRHDTSVLALSQREDQVSTREHAIMEKEGAVSARDSELEELAETLRHQEESLLRARTEHQTSLADFQRKEDELKARKGDLSTREEGVKASERRIRDRLESFSIREQQILDAEMLHRQNVGLDKENLEREKTCLQQRRQQHEAEEQRLSTWKSELEARESDWARWREEVDARIAHRQRDIHNEEVRLQALATDLRRHQQSVEEHIQDLWTRFREEMQDSSTAPNHFNNPLIAAASQSTPAVNFQPSPTPESSGRTE
ncbi:hypothetical protein VNI00_011155 [Paramarasmius palmivorus]|uniref:Uncharacterized protein n=1 Tax=Paramarasmius palmivorus TaxID=297713 RepID=A0AAW0CD67_9AGAR